MQFPKKDVSVGHRPSESGIVDTVMVTTNSMGYKLVKVRVRQVRVTVGCTSKLFRPEFLKLETSFLVDMVKRVL